MMYNSNVNFTLFKKRGWFYVDFWYEGRRYKRSTKTQKKGEAREIARLVIESTIKDIHNHSECTLTQLISKYIDLIKVENKNWYAKIYKLKLFIDCIGDKKLADISPADCQQYINKLSKGKISKASINRYISTIKHLFNKAIFTDP